MRKLFRAILAVRPLLIAMFFLGATVFFPLPKANVPPPTTGEGIKTTRTNGETKTAKGSAVTNDGLPAPSLLAEIFGATAVDPFFKLPEEVTKSQNPSSATNAEAPTEPTTEPARSIYRYLVASSDIGFKKDESRLSLALATAEQGEMKLLDALIADWEAKTAQFASLTPPEELREIHEASLKVLRRYIDFLKEVRASGSGSIKKTWGSPERSEIGSEAGQLVEKLRDIVHTYNIVLPDGVLP